MPDTSDPARDELLLTALMDLVPTPATMANLIKAFSTTSTAAESAHVITMLKGYGTLLNVIQAASELEGSMTDRLYAAYYELTANDCEDE